MRILFLSNFYPPYERGGQGRSCQYVIEMLKERGHQAAVLTSRHGFNNGHGAANGIYRQLYLEMEMEPWRNSLTFFRRKGREQHNIQRFEDVADGFNPDVVFIWGMWNLPWSLPALAEAKFPGRVLYRFADYWPTLPSQHELYWRQPGRRWFSELLKRPLRRLCLALLAREDPRPRLRYEHAICVSTAVREILVKSDVPVSDARIIYTGIDVTPYLNGKGDRRPRRNKGRSLRVLYAGRLSPEKGIETAIEGVGRLAQDHQFKDIKLSLAGSGHPDYVRHLVQLVDMRGLGEQVSFLGYISPANMPAAMRQYEALLVPSIWPEPFSRVVLEGMISELAIVATKVGGTAEIVADGKNGLLVNPGNAADLAEKIALLATEKELGARLARAGRQTVLEKFTLDKMIDEIERFLVETVETH